MRSFLKTNEKEEIYMNNDNSSCSVASLICSLVSIFILPFIFGIASIILGIIGISKQEEKKTNAIVGIIIGIFSVLYAFYSTGAL